MPTNRQKRQRNRRPVQPAWAGPFRDGKVPPYCSDAYAELVGWMFHSDTVPGLPEPDSPEALALIDAAQPAFDEILAEARVTVPAPT